MDKSIGFDIEHRHTRAWPAQVAQPDRYRKLRANARGEAQKAV